MLPKRDGFSVLNILRNTHATPVIIVSAKHAEEERIQGLIAGADDYLAKPFNKAELLLRIEALLRRTLRVTEPNQDVLTLDEFIADKRAQQVTVSGKPTNVTPTESGLLWILLQNRGEVLSKAFPYQMVFHRSYSQYDRSLDMHLSRIRRKLNQVGWDVTRLQTVHGKGYRII